jgi:hypothetical protein
MQDVPKSSTFYEVLGITGVEWDGSFDFYLSAIGSLSTDIHPSEGTLLIPHNEILITHEQAI